MDSKPCEGISNEAFSTSPSIPEINMNKKSNSDQSAESHGDTVHSTSSNKTQGVFTVTYFPHEYKSGKFFKRMHS